MANCGIYNDDCLKILPNIESNSIDCVITDCPYHIVPGGCTNDAVKIGRSFNEFDEKCYTRQGKLFKYNEIKFEEWLPEIYRVLKDDTHCYIMVNARNLMNLQNAAEQSGFIFQNLLVWDKGNSLPNRYYMNSYELILMLRKGKARNINNMGTSNIIRVANIVRNKRHPTEKPVSLMKILIKNSTNPNDIILDPFMGVGGTMVAAKELGRKYIGTEIDEKYYEVAKQRLEQKTPEEYEQMSIFDLGVM